MKIVRWTIAIGLALASTLCPPLSAVQLLLIALLVKP